MHNTGLLVATWSAGSISAGPAAHRRGRCHSAAGRCHGLSRPSPLWRVGAEAESRRPNLRPTRDAHELPVRGACPWYPGPLTRPWYPGLLPCPCARRWCCRRIRTCLMPPPPPPHSLAYPPQRARHFPEARGRTPQCGGGGRRSSPAIAADEGALLPSVIGLLVYPPQRVLWCRSRTPDSGVAAPLAYWCGVSWAMPVHVCAWWSRACPRTLGSAPDPLAPPSRTHSLGCRWSVRVHANGRLPAVCPLLFAGTMHMHRRWRTASTSAACPGVPHLLRPRVHGATAVRGHLLQCKLLGGLWRALVIILHLPLSGVGVVAHHHPRVPSALCHRCGRRNPPLLCARPFPRTPQAPVRRQLQWASPA
jgi:hypothetical protein